LDRFYRYRRALSPPPPAAATASLAGYDLPEVPRAFVPAAPDGSHSAELLVSGITCSACAWHTAHHLAPVPGAEPAADNAATHRCLLRWRPEAVAPSRLLAAFEAIGYEARPAGDEGAERKRGREAKLFLLRLGVAGLGMMQAGHAAIGLYA